jgi:mannose-6-phosphate isomerase-like protein (cupin superfamily)
LNDPAIRKLENHVNATPLPSQATIVAPEQALMIKPFGLNMKVQLTTEATGGAVSIIIRWHKRGEGPLDHVHFRHEEIFYILDGIYELTVGERTEAVCPGTVVFIPRNVVHRFKNIGDTTACMLDWSLPAGQDHYLQEISKLAGGGFTREQVTEISEKFDTNFPATH